MNYRKITGNRGEDFVEKYLISREYLIIRRNYHTRYGEIDIICKDRTGIVVFVEVKCRKTAKYGLPHESVRFYKKQKIYNTAIVYLQENNLENCNWRVDVVSVILKSNNQLREISHFKNISYG